MLIDKEFQALIPDPTIEEFNQLKENLLDWGCLDTIKVWAGHNIIIDGHNRYQLCQELKLEFKTEALEFDSREDVLAWIVENQLGRRNLTPQQLSYLRGLQYRQEKKAHGGDRKTGEKSKGQIDPLISTSEKLAKKHGVSPKTIKRDAKFAEAVDVVAEALPEAKAKILQGASPLSKGDVIAVAEDVTLAPAEQKPQTAKAGMAKQRVANDYYPTPDKLIEALTNTIAIKGTILEPCAGHGAIAAHFPGCITNEPFPTGDFLPDYQLDAANEDLWDALDAPVDWVITNPPYGELATPIVKNALEYAQVGVAMLLRLNWLEPCADRAGVLQAWADQLTHIIIVNPRPKFRADTNGSDNITVAWVVWQKKWSWKRKKIPCPFGFANNWKNLHP
jgi:hypothetical protein